MNTWVSLSQANKHQWTSTMPSHMHRLYDLQRKITHAYSPCSFYEVIGEFYKWNWRTVWNQMSVFFHLRHCHLSDGKRFFLCFLIVSNDSELQQLEVNSLTDNSQWKLMLGKEFKGLWLLERDCQNQVQSMGKSSHHEDYLDWGRRWVNTVRDSNCETGSYLGKVWCWVHYCIWWLCMVNSNHQAGVRNNLSHPRKSASLKFICVQIPSTHLHPTSIPFGSWSWQFS